MKFLPLVSSLLLCNTDQEGLELHRNMAVARSIPTTRFTPLVQPANPGFTCKPTAQPCTSPHSNQISLLSHLNSFFSLVQYQRVYMRMLRLAQLTLQLTLLLSSPLSKNSCIPPSAPSSTLKSPFRPLRPHSQSELYH